MDPTRLLGSVEVIAPLHPSRPREVALVRLGDEQYVLKSKRPPKGRLKQWRVRLSGHADIAHEAQIYQALEGIAPIHFRVPKLIATDARHFLLMEYLPNQAGRARDPHDLCTAARAIAEFQQLAVAFKAPLVRHALHRFQGVYNIERFVRKLQGVLPPGTGRAIAACILSLHRAQPRLSRSVLVHNDLNPENLAPDADGRLVLLDFAAVARVRRWIFGDVVAYGFNGKSDWWIAPSLVAAYVTEMEAALPGQLVSAVQLRHALIAKVLHTIRFRQMKRRSTDRAVTFLHETLLDERAYAAWYDALLATGRAELAASAAP